MLIIYRQLEILKVSLTTMHYSSHFSLSYVVNHPVYYYIGRQSGARVHTYCTLTATRRV